MSTQRPFFGNFFAIFRAHTPHIPKTTASVSAAAASTTTTSTSQSIWATAAAASLSKQLVHTTDKQATSPRPINAKTSPYNAQTTTAAQERQIQNSLSPALQHNVSPQTHLPRTPSTGSLPSYGPVNRPQPPFSTFQESKSTRRGSDCSSDSGGFRDVRAGGEKWFIGGITSTGEEKYYKLGMVRRERSADRISADQLSL